MSTQGNDPLFCSYGCKIIFESLEDLLDHEYKGRKFGSKGSYANLAEVHGRSPYNIGAIQIPDEHIAAQGTKPTEKFKMFEIHRKHRRA